MAVDSVTQMLTGCSGTSKSATAVAAAVGFIHVDSRHESLMNNRLNYTHAAALVYKPINHSAINL